MNRRLITSLSLSTLVAASGCLLETAVGPGAVSSDPPAARSRPAVPRTARAPVAVLARERDAATEVVVAEPRPAPKQSTAAAPASREPSGPAAKNSADRYNMTAGAPSRQPSDRAEKKVAVKEPTLNMTTGAPWQLEPETDAQWQGTLVQRPGPRAISRENPICNAAHNHCLHSNTWFVSNMPEEPISQAQVAFRFDERFWRWSDAGQVGPYDPRYGEFLAYRTLPATVKNARPGAVIVFHRNGDNENSHDPRFSNDARASENWHIGRIADVNAGDGTFRFTEGKRFHPLAHARVAIETISVR